MTTVFLAFLFARGRGGRGRKQNGKVGKDSDCHSGGGDFITAGNNYSKVNGWVENRILTDAGEIETVATTSVCLATTSHTTYYVEFQVQKESLPEKKQRVESFFWTGGKK